MQIVVRSDLFFVGLHASLIILAAALVFSLSGQAIVLLVMLALLAFYLVLALRRPWRRWQALNVPMPAFWRDFLAAHSAYYRGLDEAGRKRFERDVILFLSDEPVAAIGGSAVDWGTRLRIGAGVAMMLHGRPEWEPPLLDGITVYPGQSFDLNYRVRTGNIAGMAPEGGPLLIAEENVLRDATGDGRDVLIHELAHFFDRGLRKGGGVVSRSRKGDAIRWADFIAAEWQKHLQQGSILPSYAAQNEAEFFAVTCELFFTRPGPLQAAHPELYDALAVFFNQDPRRVLGDR
jgi:Mlc titration factor MtfA (ptsG expression regulator)